MKTLNQTLCDLQDLLTAGIITNEQYDTFAKVAIEKLANGAWPPVKKLG